MMLSLKAALLCIVKLTDNQAPFPQKTREKHLPHCCNAVGQNCFFKIKVLGSLWEKGVQSRTPTQN